MYLYFEVAKDTDMFNFRGEAPKADIESFARIQKKLGLKSYVSSSAVHGVQTKQISGAFLRKSKAVLAGGDE